MQIIKREELPEQRQVRLTIAVDKDTWQASLAKCYQGVKSVCPVAGEPTRENLEQAYGPEFLYQEAVNDTYPQALVEAISQSDIQIAGTPTLSVETIGPDGYTFAAVIDLYPEVELGQYKGLSAVYPQVELSNDDTEAALDEYARANPEVQHPERAAMGDEVTLDFEGFVDGVPFEGGKGEQYPLLLGSGAMKRRQRRFATYLRTVGQKQAVPLDYLARAADVSRRRVEKDVNLMLEKGLWGDEAYIDMGSGMLFKSQAAATAYFDAAHRAKAEQGQPAQTAPAPAGYAAILAQIRELNDRIADEAISAKLDRMEQVSGRIFKLIEEDEAKRDAAGTFLNYYLPTTLKLLENYASFEEAGVSGENLSQAKAKIEKTMDSIVAGFEHQLDELYRTDAMDIDSDIRVMETMLRRDTASVADDFGLNGSSAVQQRDE